MRVKHVLPVLGMCAVLGLASLPTRAGLLVSNLGNTVNSSLVIGSLNDAATASHPLANSFTTGAGSSWDLLSVTLKASLLGSQSVVGDLYVFLYSDSAGMPGTQITGFGFNSPTSLTPSEYLFTPSSAVTLLPSTTYWVVTRAFDFGSHAYFWATTANDGQTGASGWSIGDTLYQENGTAGNWTAAASGEPGLFSVQGNAVPLPGTALLLAPALGVLGWAHRRRRRP